MSNPIEIKNLPPVPEGVTNVEMSFGKSEGLGGKNWRCWDGVEWNNPEQRGQITSRLYARWDEPEPKVEPAPFIDIAISEWNQQGPLGAVQSPDGWNVMAQFIIGCRHYVDKHEYRMEGFVYADGCGCTTPTNGGVKAVAGRFYLVKESE